MWGGCLHKDSTPSSSQAASRSKVLLDNLAAAGLLKGYHALGGMKFVLFGSGDGHDENANDKLYTGIYFGYEATDAAAISDVDTGSFTCSWQ